jgi:microcystin-dependent protein
MSDQYLGEIRAFPFNFPPKGWVLCNGQTLPINQNQALFALLGTTYGGNGTTTFQLPNLQGTLAMGQGQPGTTVGETIGEEFHTLILAESPSHTHSVNAYATPANPTSVPDSTMILAAASSDQTGNPAVLVYGANTPNTPMAPLNTTAGNQPHENRMPYQVLSYCIAMTGIFPSRN